MQYLILLAALVGTAAAACKHPDGTDTKLYNQPCKGGRGVHTYTPLLHYSGATNTITVTNIVLLGSNGKSDYPINLKDSLIQITVCTV